MAELSDDKINGTVSRSTMVADRARDSLLVHEGVLAMQEEIVRLRAALEDVRDSYQKGPEVMLAAAYLGLDPKGCAEMRVAAKCEHVKVKLALSLRDQWRCTKCGANFYDGL